MILAKSVSELSAYLQEERAKGNNVGFVPTMGALHEGHTSLVVKAKGENNVVVCSIFINPTQFNDQSDLVNYPKTPEKDYELLLEAGCDCLFIPSVEDIYPETVDFELDFGNLEAVMEGTYRPGHFKGVAMVVSRFFELIAPDRAYFGEKDFQQLSVIRELVKKTGSGVEIIGCPTLREPNGLAMSSRNIFLNDEELKSSSVIYESLKMASELISKHGPEAAKKQMINNIESVQGFRVQYLEFVDSLTLQPITELRSDRQQRVCVAVLTAKTRLIDNISL